MNKIENSAGLSGGIARNSLGQKLYNNFASIVSALCLQRPKIGAVENTSLTRPKFAERKRDAEPFSDGSAELCGMAPTVPGRREFVSA